MLRMVMWNKLPNLGCAAPHTSWNRDLTGFHQLAEGASRPPPRLPPASGAEHPGTLPVPHHPAPPRGHGEPLAGSPDSQLHTQELLGMRLPALFPRWKFPRDRGDDGIYAGERHRLGIRHLPPGLGLPQRRWDSSGGPRTAQTLCQP